MSNNNVKNEFLIDNLIKGLLKASERLYKDIEEKVNESIFYSLAETIFWINTITERITVLKDSQWEKEVKAIRCAFNFIKHNKNILNITVLRGGKSYPYSYPYSYGYKYIFADLTNVECKRGRELIEYYQKYLMGKDIKPTMESYISKLL